MARVNRSAPIALGGVLAALAVVIMALGGMIPLSTFVCPVLAMLLLRVIIGRCSARVAWAWYGAVAFLSALLSPDKEAAAVFIFLGYYPILKPKLDKLPLKWLWKLLLFNIAILSMYALLMYIFGMTEVIEEFAELGTVMTLVTLALGNATFILLDNLLGKHLRRRR